jgi:hypothetical protein
MQRGGLKNSEGTECFPVTGGGKSIRTQHWSAALKRVLFRDPPSEFWYVWLWNPISDPPNAHMCSQKICSAKHEEHHAAPPSWSLNSIIAHVESQAFQKLSLWAPTFSALPTKCKSSLIPSVHQSMACIFILPCSTLRNTFCVTNYLQVKLQNIRAPVQKGICVGINLDVRGGCLGVASPGSQTHTCNFRTQFLWGRLCEEMCNPAWNWPNCLQNFTHIKSTIRNSSNTKRIIVKQIKAKRN